jgi:hypothetical protein
MLLFTVCLFVLGGVYCLHHTACRESVRVSWLCEFSSRRDRLIRIKWMLCNIVRLRARSASVVEGHGCPRSTSKDRQALSFRLLFVAQLRLERIHIFRHEALVRRLRRASLQVPPRSLRAIVFHRVRSWHVAFLFHRIRSRRITPRRSTLKDLGLFTEDGTVLLASFRATQLRLELIIEVFPETRSVGSVDIRSACLFAR